MTRGNHICPISQASECVIPRTICHRRGTTRTAQGQRRTASSRCRIDRSGKAVTRGLKRVATVPMVPLGVGRIYLVVVGRAGGQAGKRRLVARNHRRINWRTISVGGSSSVIDRGVCGDVCDPHDLRAGDCAVCTLVMTRVDGGLPALLEPLTKPAQPLKNTTEQPRIAALTPHTNLFKLVFTVASSSGLRSARRPGTGVGPLRLKWLHSGLNYRRRIKRQAPARLLV